MLGLGFMLFNAISTIFQLYRVGQFYWWRNPEYPEKTTDPPVTCPKSLTNFITVLYWIHLSWTEFELATLVGDRHWFNKFNYHMIMITTTACNNCRNDAFISGKARWKYSLLFHYSIKNIFYFKQEAHLSIYN